MTFFKRIFYIAVALVLYSPISHACKPDLHDRDIPVEQLVNRTATIVLVKVKSYKKSKSYGFLRKVKFDYMMEVLSVLKGDKNTKTILLKEFDGPEAGDFKIEVGFDCYNYGGFKENNLYLVFLDSAHFKAYRRVHSESDPWFIEVKGKIK